MFDAECPSRRVSQQSEAPSRRMSRVEINEQRDKYIHSKVPNENKWSYGVEVFDVAKHRKTCPSEDEISVPPQTTTTQASLLVSEGLKRRKGQRRNEIHWTKVTVGGKEVVFERSQQGMSGGGGGGGGGYDDNPVGGVAIVTGGSALTPSHSKAQCSLCSCYFARESLNGVISMKRILDLRRRWGVKVEGRRFNAASFMYAKARLCVFCTQLFHVGDAPVAKKDARKGGAREEEEEDDIGQQMLQHIEIGHGNKERSLFGDAHSPGGDSNAKAQEVNIAFNCSATQSSTADGLSARVAVDGHKDSQSSENCSRTRRQFEAWWEVDLGENFPIRSVTIYPRVNSGVKRPYVPTPFWIMVCAFPMEHRRLHESKQLATQLTQVTDRQDKYTWSPPRNTFGSCIRIQAEGIVSLQLAQVCVAKGGAELSVQAEMAAKHQEAGMSSSGSVGGRSVGSGISRASSVLGGLGAAHAVAKMRRTDYLLQTCAPDHHGRIAGRTSSRVPHKAINQLGFGSPTGQRGGNSVDHLFVSTAIRYDEKDWFDYKVNRAKKLLQPKEMKGLYATFASMRRRHQDSAAEPVVMSDELCAGLRSLVIAVQTKQAMFNNQSLADLRPSPVLKKIADQSVTEDLPAAILRVRHRLFGLAEKSPHLSVSWSQFLLILERMLSRRMGDLSDIFNVDVEEERPMERTLLADAGGPTGCGAGAGGGSAAGTPLGGNGGKDGDEGGGSAIDRRDDAMPSIAAEKKNMDALSATARRKRQTQRTVATTPASAFVADTLGISRAATTGGLNAEGIQWAEECEDESLLANDGSRRSMSYLEFRAAQSEAKFVKLASRFAGDLGRFQKLPAYGEGRYRERLEERTDKQRTMFNDAALPDIEPHLPYRNCGLCSVIFPVHCLVETVTLKTLGLLHSRWGMEADKFTQRVDNSLSRYDRLSVCVFCSQFFDPDQESGLSSVVPHSNGAKVVGYVPFFDDRFPDRVSDDSSFTKALEDSHGLVKRPSSSMWKNREEAKRTDYVNSRLNKTAPARFVQGADGNWNWSEEPPAARKEKDGEEGEWDDVVGEEAP